jgi:hypothetical protein
MDPKNPVTPTPKASWESLVDSVYEIGRLFLSGTPVPAMLWFFVPLTLLGMVVISGYPRTDSSAAYMMALSSLAAGAAFGFLFGIPRQPGPRSGADTTRADNGADATANTNLVDVSDWLTKIIVGLGLVQFDAVRRALGRIVRVFAHDLGGPAAMSFAGASVTYFAVTGFISGYVLTRLVLPRAFAFTVEDLRREVHTRVKQEIAPVEAKAKATSQG